MPAIKLVEITLAIGSYLFSIKLLTMLFELVFAQYDDGNVFLLPVRSKMNFITLQ